MRIILIFLALSMCFCGCKKVDEVLTFPITYSDNFTVPSLVGANVPVSLPIPPVTTNSEQTFNEHNTAASLVKNVKINSLVFEIVEPKGKSFGFLKSINFFLSSTNQAEKMVLSTSDIPDDIGSVLEFQAIQDNYDIFIKDQEIKLRAEVTIDETLTEEVTVKATINFSVTADPL